MCTLLQPIKRSKYPTVTQEEEAISIPLQVLALAVFDAILVHVMNVCAPSSLNWPCVCPGVVSMLAACGGSAPGSCIIGGTSPPTCGGIVGLRVWQEHLVLLPDSLCRAMCPRCGLTSAAGRSLEREP